MTTAAIYARVSTDEQAEKHTIENQLDACRSYCERAGFEVVNEFLDAGVSGTVALAERPAGARLIADADAKSFEVVVCYRLDRFGREVVTCLLAIKRLQTRVKLEYVDERFDDSPSGQFSQNVMSAVAQLEHGLIRQRTMAGRERRVRDGKYCAPVTPYGYVKINSGDDKGQLEADPETAPVVQQIFELAASGLSTRSIATRLNDGGVQQPKDTPNKNKGPFPGWNAATIRNILKAPRYTGKATYGSARTPMQSPALVDAAVFAKVGEGMAAKKLNSSRNTKPENKYLLQNLLVCGHCGKGYSGFTNGKYRCYFCYFRRANGAKAGHEGIRWRYNADYLEAAVLDWVARTVWSELGDQAFTGFEFEVADDSLANVADTALRRAEAELTDIDARRKRTLDAVGRGVIDDDDAQAALAELTTSRADAMQVLTREREAIAKSANVQERANAWVAWLKSHADERNHVAWTLDDFESAPFEVKREFIKLMIDRITVEDEDGNGMLRIEGRVSSSVPLYLNQQPVDFEIVDDVTVQKQS